MPPKKRVRGPALSPVKEDSTGLTPTKAASTAQPTTSTKPEKSTDEIAREEAELDKELDAESQVASKKKAPAVKVSAKKKNAEKMLRENIVASFRQTFQARANITDNIKHSSQQLLGAYKKTTRGQNAISKDVFFNELDIRLCMIIEDTTVIENRVRVMKLVCETAVNLYTELNDESILDFLVVEFFKTWSKSVETNHRANIASFIGYLFESGIPKSAEEKSKLTTFALYRIKYVRRLYLYLLALIRDKTQVRVAAIRSFSILQKCHIPSDFKEALEISPREVLVRSFRDVAWECRLAAIELFIPSAEHATELTQLALFDKCTQVRCVALKTFAELKLKDTDWGTKLDLLYTCLIDHDPAIRRTVHDYVLNEWIDRLAESYKKRFNSAPDSDCVEVDSSGRPLTSHSVSKKVEAYGCCAQMLLFWFVDVASTEIRSQIRLIMMSVLDVTRKLYRVNEDNIHNFATSIIEDVKNAEDSQILTRSTCFDLIEANTDMKTRERMVFFWRVLIEFMVDREKNVNNAAMAIERMAPKMLKMCELVRGTLEMLKNIETSGKDWGKPVLDWELFSIQQTNILKDLLLIFRHLDRDSVGMTAYKRLLEDMLYNINNHKSLIDIIIQDLSANFYNENPSDILSDVSASFSDMMTRVTCGDQTMRDETVFIGSCTSRKVTEEDREVLDAISDYELMVVNAILKTGKIENICPILKTKYETLISPKLRSQVLDERILAMECVGIIGTINLERIEEDLLICRDISEMDEIAAKCCYIDVVVDLSVVHKLENVQNLLDSGASRRRDAKSIIDSMCDVILTDDENLKNSDLALKCCEGLGKILLHEEINPSDEKWQKAIFTLMSRLNYKLDSKFASKVRSVITSILRFFASLSINNQHCIVNCFEKFFHNWDRNQNLLANAGNSEYIYRRLCRCASLFACLTRKSLLINQDPQEVPAQVKLLHNALQTLIFSEETASAANYYSEVLPWIEVELIPRHEAQHLYEQLRDNIDILTEGDTKGRLAELKKLQRRFGRMLGINDKTGENELEPSQPIKDLDEEMPDIVSQTPRRGQTNATPASKRRNVTKSSSKTLSAKKAEVEDLVNSPVEESVTKRVQRPPSEPRVPLKRSARRAARPDK